MKNIDNLAKYITKNGEKSIRVHTIPKTGTWIIAQKIEESKWSLSMGKPLGNVMYNVGIISEENHIALWEEITKMEIETRASAELQAQQLKNKINNFIKRNQQYKNFIKIDES